MAVSHVCGCQTCSWLVDYCSRQSRTERERERDRKREKERENHRQIKSKGKIECAKERV